MMNCMLWICISMFAGMHGQRQSPDIASSISTSIRSSIMLPARLLTKKESLSCDSLMSGPFCVLTNNSTRILTEGLLDRRIWGDVSSLTYYNLYSSLSDYAADHWSGSAARVHRANRITSLVGYREGRVGLQFEPNALPVDADSFTASSSSLSLYTLNSLYGFISFVYSVVSVTSFRVKAPLDSHVLVRAYCGNLPVWFRLVRSGSIVDVALPSDREDPSVEAIDMIEVIGLGAEILSLSVSFATPSPYLPTYLFVDRDLEHPSRYAGIRAFPPSAHLVDMQTVMETDLQWVSNAPPLLIAGQDEYDVFSVTAVTSKRHLLPAKYWDYFVLSLGAKNSTSFEEQFSTSLIESSPQLLSALLSSHSEAALSFDEPDDLETLVASIQHGLLEVRPPRDEPIEKLTELRNILIEVFHLEINLNTPLDRQKILLQGALESLLVEKAEGIQDLVDLLVSVYRN